MKSRIISILIASTLMANISYAQAPACEVISTTPADVCKGQTAILSATGKQGNYIRWYDQMTGGNLIEDSSNTLTINNPTTSGTYYAEAFGGVAVPDSINTLTANNGQSSAMFDCKPLTNITVTGFNFTPRSSTTYTASIYYKTGTMVGSETNSNAWTLLGTSNSFSASSNVLTRIPVTFSQTLSANQTYAFYVHVTGGTLGYTNGSTLGATAVSNSDIEIYQGRGGSGLFSGSLFTVRTFAGTMLYEVGGACVSNREPVALNVIDYTGIDSQNTQITVCTGLNGDLFVKPKGSINNYRWQIYDDATNGYKDVVAGAQYSTNDNILTVNNASSSINNSLYRLILDGICGNDTSADIRLIVDPLPEVEVPPSDKTHNPGETAVFEVTAVGSNVTYQWQVGNKDSFVNVNNGGIYSGVKTKKLTVTAVSFAQNEFQFRCVISGKGNCVTAPDTSNFAVLYVTPPQSVSSINNDGAVKLYPNPANNQVVVSVENTFNNADYTITDKLGRIVSRGQLSETGNTTISISSLPADVYTIQVVDTEHSNARALRFTKL